MRVGLMGLCMGFSFVSLAEIFYYFGQLVYTAFMKPKSNPGSPSKEGQVWAIGKEN